MAQRVKHLSAMQETQVQSLGQEDPPWRRKWHTPFLLSVKTLLVPILCLRLCEVSKIKE